MDQFHISFKKVESPMFMVDSDPSIFNNIHRFMGRVYANWSKHAEMCESNRILSKLKVMGHWR